MSGELDGAVDSLSVSAERAPRGAGVLSGSGESPGLTGDYHLDQPLDRRQAFAKSAADDGGIVILASPSPAGAASREALLASNQDGQPEGATVVMRPRVVEQHRGDGKARRGQGIPVNAADVGLALRPIMIQRQADHDEMGNPLDPEGSEAKPFASDGTAKGGARINELGSVVLPNGKVAAEAPRPAAAATAAPQAQAPMAPYNGTPGAPAPLAPKQRIVYEPPGGGRIRAAVSDVIVSATIIMVVSDLDSDTSYEPAKATSEAPIKLSVGDQVYEVVYGNWSAEKDGRLYLVFVRLPPRVVVAPPPAPETKL